MKIYIDFDDVICETARYFTKIADQLFGIKVPYEQVKFFNLQKAFNLTESQYAELMAEGHKPEVLLSYEETPDASKIINKWVNEGHEVSVITGRPFDSFEPSRKWLDEHNLSRIPLFCVDKYGREKFYQSASFNMSLQDFYAMTFDFAVEDSPAAFEHLMHFENCQVAVFDRPWNKNAVFPSDKFSRGNTWDEIDKMLMKKMRG